MKRAISILLSFAMVLTMLPLTAVAQAVVNKNSSYSNIVLFVQFSDTEGNFMSSETDVNNARKYYTDESYPKSLISYVKTISYNQMTIKSYLPQYDSNANTITPLVLSKTRNWYVDNNNNYTIEKEAIDLFNSKYTMNGGDIDLDGNGTVDNVTFIYAGGDGARLSLFYPKKSDYDGIDTIGGKRVGTINTLTYESVFEYGSIQRESVICHEFLHSLGYPDLYTENSSSTPVGRWDLMASSSTYLQYPLAYLRSLSGWLNINTVTENSNLTLVPQQMADGNQAYILKSPLSDSEFFVIEYRKQGKAFTNDLDIKIPGSGLIVYRINTKAQRLSNYNGLPYGIYVFRPNETSVNGADPVNLNNSFYSQESGRTSVGTTQLNAGISDGALVFSDGTNSGIEISNIGSAGDTISCKVSFADTTNIGLWKTLGGTYLTNQYSSAISIDTDKSGTPYVAYSAYDNLRISKFNGTSWVQVGSDIPNYSSNAVIRIFNGIPYVAYSKSNDDFTMVVAKYVNGVWTNIKTAKSSKNYNYIQYISMEKGEDGIYLCYADGDYNAYKLVLEKYNGTAWTTISDNVTTGSVSNPDLSVDGNDVYIAYRNYSTEKADVYHYNGTTLTSMNAQTVSCNSSVKVCAGDDKVYLLSDNTNGLTVYQYNSNGSWTQIGTQALTKIQSATTDICIMNGVPVIQLVNQDNSSVSNTQIFRYRNGTWVQEGTTIDTSLSNDAEMAVYNNFVYLAYLSENGEDSFPYVKMKELQVLSTDIPVSEGKKLTGIAVTPPTKTNYKTGETIDLSGMVVTAMYSDISTTILESGKYNVSGFDTTTTGKKEVVVSYGGYSESFEITVEKAPLAANDVEGAVISKFAVQTYLDGLEITPLFNVRLGNKLLLKGRDYTVTYKNNINIGTATVVISGKGNYIGTVEKNFTIAERTNENVPKPLIIGKQKNPYAAVVAWVPDFAANGTEIMYADNESFTNAKTSAVEGYGINVKAIDNLKYDLSNGYDSSKDLYVKVRAYILVDGVKKYSQWSASRLIKA